MGQTIHFTSHDPKETIDFGSRLAKIIQPKDIFCLSGDLGSGKTTLVKGLTKGLKVKSAYVNSPTFVLMNIYEGKLPVYHFDLYRVEGKELLNIGYEEYFYGNGVSVIEWAERLGKQMPKEFFQIQLEHAGENERKIILTAKGKLLNERLEKIKTIKRQ